MVRPANQHRVNGAGAVVVGAKTDHKAAYIRDSEKVLNDRHIRPTGQGCERDAASGEVQRPGLRAGSGDRSTPSRSGQVERGARGVHHVVDRANCQARGQCAGCGQHHGLAVCKTDGGCHHRRRGDRDREHGAGRADGGVPVI